MGLFNLAATEPQFSLLRKGSYYLFFVSADNLYNIVPYPSLTFPQTHPDRLATIATIYGMNPAKPEKCRVLELGCGDGSNLLSFAYALPASEFIGVDFSERHIADAKRTAKELNLKNIFFHQEDVMNINRIRFGEFDFIIAHGLISWIPDFVRQKVFEIYGESLAPEGVGYISYNALPGFHIRAMMREMMLFHVEEIAEPIEKIQQGITILGFLSEAVEPDSLYQTIIKTELAEIVERPPGNVFHDELEEYNQPFYFYEFVNQIKPHGLQFLCEAEPISMQTNNLTPKVRQALAALSGGDVVRREQYLDFIKCRRFRKTLVCRKEIALNRNPQPEILNNFFIASQIRPESETPEIKTRKTEKFVGLTGASLSIDHPLTKAALAHLGKIWAQSIKFEELISTAREMISEPPDFDFENEKRQTAAFLLQMFDAGFVKFQVYEPKFATEISEFPEASAFARRQAADDSDSVTTLTGTNLKIEDDLVRMLLILLDGTRNREALAAEILARFEGDNKSVFERELPDLLESTLSRIAKSGLLIG